MDQTIFNPKILDMSAYELKDILCFFPNMWYPIIKSGHIRGGEVKPLFVIGHNLVVFRGSKSGKVHVLDAFCPHFGAHLGVGGNVVGENIRCPFHNWIFDGNGVCLSVPGLNVELLPNAKVKSWECYETNDWVYIWYHKNDEKPKYKPTTFKVLSNSCIFGEQRTHWHGHFIDIFSNISDSVHFNEIHSMQATLGAQHIIQKTKLYNFFYRLFHVHFDNHRIEFVKDQDCGEQPTAMVYICSVPVVLGRPLNKLKVELTFKVCPPTYLLEQNLVNFQLKCRVFIAFIPVEPLKHLMVTTIYHNNSILSRLFARLFFYLVKSAAQPEQIIFNNKMFLMNPCFTSLDKLQVKYLKWFKHNFY